MNAKEAKQVSIEGILSKFGYEPSKEKKSGDELWYCSPFREEKTPSFKVSVSKNLFYDYGEGRGGNALDLVIILLNSDVSGALRWLRDFTNHDVFQSAPMRKVASKKVGAEENPLQVSKIKELENPALLSYLSSRCIELDVARRYAVEVYYKNTRNGKSYFGVGFENISGGYAVRNKYCKSLIGKNNISFVKGEMEDGRLEVFEGFSDFLSHKSINRYFPHTDTIVLNSTSNFKKAVELINGGNYQEITIWSDNDEAGRKLVDSFEQEFSKTIYIRSQGHLYKEHNDLNAYWKHLHEKVGGLKS